MQISISWVMTLLALFGWGTTTGATPNHQVHKPAITRSATSPSPVAESPSPTPVTSSSPSPTSSATVTANEIASEATCPGQSDLAKTVSTLNCLTNNARVFHGLKPLADNQPLLAAASGKTQDMAKCGYGHTACGLPFEREILAHGYTGHCYGENIAMGQATPHDVFVAWMNSPGHRANILNADYRDLGVAETASSQGPLWAMELGGC